MIIGILTLDFHLPMCHSLKSKRFVIKSLKDRLANKFNVAVAEVDYIDVWQRTQLAIVTVSREKRRANEILSKVVNIAGRESEAMLTKTDMQFL
ncbi:MAG: DUF503 domain-containing protein [Candidatus Glassbacteria bacterium]